MVMATLELMSVITSTPRKLNTAAIMMALGARMERVDTQVAMALGASVQPFTMITPSVSATVTASMGLLNTCERKSVRGIVIIYSVLTFSLLIFSQFDYIIIKCQAGIKKSLSSVKCM